MQQAGTQFVVAVNRPRDLGTAAVVQRHVVLQLQLHTVLTVLSQSNQKVNILPAHAGFARHTLPAGSASFLGRNVKGIGNVGHGQT